MEVFFAALLLLWLGRKPRTESEEIEQGLLAAFLLVALAVGFGVSLSCHERRDKAKPPSC